MSIGFILVFHIWPGALPGGYVGVDVFFVISGFLITGHLLKERPSTGRDLATFWMRRIRRLLPAALLVVAVTLLATRLFAPETQWSGAAAGARASALYVQNWNLANSSVDYLAEDDAPSVFQHYWSLSAEEQFYLLWPIVVLICVWAARPLRARLEVVALLAMTALLVSSFVYSVLYTRSSPAQAYFVTPTRAWEFALGGVVAAGTLIAAGRQRSFRWSGALRLGAVWVGFGGIVASAVLYRADTPFPGWAALLPTVGAALVIAGRVEDGFTPNRALANPAAQYLGDISYSTYLWHWPLVVLGPYAVGSDLTAGGQVAVLVASVGLGSLSKHYVEDRYRAHGPGVPLGVPYRYAAGAMAGVVLLASAQSWELRRRESVDEQQLAQAVAQAGRCFGAGALSVSGCPRTVRGPVVPGLAHVSADKPAAYSDQRGTSRDCFATTPSFSVVTCSFGSTEPIAEIALVGNSHAGHWLPALEALAAEHKWRITTFLANRCALSAVEQKFDTSAHTANCASWVTQVTREVSARKLDAVVLSNRISLPAVDSPAEVSAAAYLAGYRVVLAAWKRAGVPVLAVRDTPAPGDAGAGSVPDCLALNDEDFEPCSGSRRQWLPADPIVPAIDAAHSPSMDSVDLTDHVCGPVICDAVVGGVVVYFDGSHMTKTYATTLAPYLYPPLRRLMRA